MFSHKKKKSDLERPGQQGLPPLDDQDFGLPNEFPSYPREYQGYQQPAREQQRPAPLPAPELSPRSISEGTHEIILSKIDVIEAKLDGLSKQIDMLQRLLQTLQQPPERPSQEFKDYQRRIW